MLFQQEIAGSPALTLDLPISHFFDQPPEFFFGQVRAYPPDPALDIAADPVPPSLVLTPVDRIDAELPLNFHNPPRNSECTARHILDREA